MTNDLPQVPAVTLGRSGVHSTKLALGSANWIGKVGDDAYVELLREAFRLGIRHVDTAPSYEQGWLAERLRESDPPDNLLIVTKIGRYRADDGVEYDFGPDRAVRSVHDSLEELGLERLPVLKVHDARPDHWDEIMGPNGTLKALRRLQAEGLVGAIGTAVGNADFAAMAAESGEFDIIGSYHHYTLLNQDAARRIHPHARRHNLGVINISPFGGNILGTGAVQGARYSYREATPEVLNEVRDMEARAEAHGLDLQTAALAYSLACPDVDVSVVGPTTIEELHADVAALTVAEDFSDFRDIVSPVEFPNDWF
jgi:D-threo-aldose 1-dehydrogenase